METKQLTTSQDFENSIKSGVSLIDFNAPWCGPSRSQEAAYYIYTSQLEVL